MADPGMPVPADFPEAERLSFHSRARTRYAAASPDIWRQFNGGLGGLLYRFTACAGHDEAFASSVVRDGPSPPQPARYHQDRDLFAFFVTGQSAVECLCYALYALGEMARPADFDLFAKDKPHRIDPDTTRGAYLKGFPGQPLTTQLDRVVGSADYEEWAVVRNTLVHRTHPGRDFGMTLGSGGYGVNPPMSGTSPEPVAEPTGPGSWAGWMGIPIDAGTTRSRREWLASRLRTLLVEADAFVNRLA